MACFKVLEIKNKQTRSQETPGPSPWTLTFLGLEGYTSSLQWLKNFLRAQLPTFCPSRPERSGAPPTGGGACCFRLPASSLRSHWLSVAPSLGPGDSLCCGRIPPVLQVGWRPKLSPCWTGTEAVARPTLVSEVALSFFFFFRVTF